MVHTRPRTEPVLISQDIRAVCDIHILQISKMFLVKQSGHIQELPAVNDSPAAGGKDPPRPVIFLLILTFSCGERPSERIVIIPRIVDQIPLIHIQHLCRTGKRPFPAFDINQQLSYKIRFRLGIIIQQDHVRRIRSQNPFVYGTAKTKVFRKRNQSDLRESLFHQFTASICRPVVDHDRFEPGICLPSQT